MELVTAWLVKNGLAVVGVSSFSALLGWVFKKYVRQETINEHFAQWRKEVEPKIINFGLVLGRALTLNISKWPGVGLIWNYLVEPAVIMVGGVFVSTIGWLIMMLWQGIVLGLQSDKPNFAGQTSFDKIDMVKKMTGKP